MEKIVLIVFKLPQNIADEFNKKFVHGKLIAAAYILNKNLKTKLLISKYANNYKINWLGIMTIGLQTPLHSRLVQ